MIIYAFHRIPIKSVRMNFVHKKTFHEKWDNTKEWILGNFRKMFWNELVQSLRFTTLSLYNTKFSASGHFVFYFKFSLGWKSVILEKKTSCQTSCKILQINALFLQTVLQDSCKTFARNELTLCLTCWKNIELSIYLHALTENSSVQKTFRSNEHHLIVNSASAYSVTIKKSIPDIVYSECFWIRFYLIKILASVASVLSI